VCPVGPNTSLLRRGLNAGARDEKQFRRSTGPRISYESREERRVESRKSATMGNLMGLRSKRKDSLVGRVGRGIPSLKLRSDRIRK